MLFLQQPFDLHGMPYRSALLSLSKFTEHVQNSGYYKCYTVFANVNFMLLQCNLIIYAEILTHVY